MPPYFLRCVALTAVLCTGCQGSSQTQLRRPESVQHGQQATLCMDVSATEVQAGQSVSLHCRADDGAGNAQAEIPVKMEIVPAAPVRFAEPRTIAYRPTAVGTYVVTCRSDNPTLTTPPPQTVTVVPAAPQTVRTWVSASVVPAHTPVTVRCEARDAFGNLAPQAATAFRVDGGSVAADRDSFTADRAGNYDVTCYLPHAEPPQPPPQPQSLPQPQQQPPPSPPEDEATTPGEQQGVAVQVAAGAPSRWQVQLHRQGKCFSQGRLPLTWQVFDAYDNEVDGVQVALHTDPEHGVMRDASGGYMFLDEAEYDVSLRVVSPGAADLPPWQEHIIVDSTPPHLVITSPVRGAMVQDSAATQMLTGQVYDKLSPLTRVDIAGAAQPLNVLDPKRLDFSVPHQSTWGLNMVQAAAEDACGNVALVSQSYLQAANFAPLATKPQPAAAVKSGVRVRFNQKLWDDGDRSTNDDVATLLQKALSHSHLDDRLPYRLMASPDTQGDNQADEFTYNCVAYTTTHKSGLEVTRNGPLNYESPEVEYVRTVEGGWHVAFVLRNLTVPVRLTYFWDKECLGGTQQSLDAVLVTGETRVEATAQVWVEDGEPQVSLCPSCVHISFGATPPRLQVDWGYASRHGLGQRLDNGLNWLVTGYMQSMGQALEGKVRQELTHEMGTFLRGLRLEHSLPLPAPWKGAIEVASGLDAAHLYGPEGSGYGEFGLYTQIYAREKQLSSPRFDVPVPEPLRGPIRRDPKRRADLGTSTEKSFALAVHDDLLNQMLWALWYGGAFTQTDLRDVLSQSSDPCESSLLDAATLRLFLTAPPVLMPGDAPNEVKLGVGDAYAEADCDLYGLFGVMAPAAAPRLQAGFYFSTVITAHLDVDAASGHLVVTPVGTPEIHVQVTQTSNPSFQPVVTTWLERALNRTVPPMLARALGTFPLPVLQINRMAGIPSDAVWRLHDTTLERPAGAAEFVLHGTLHEASQADAQKPAG